MLTWTLAFLAGCCSILFIPSLSFNATVLSTLLLTLTVIGMSVTAKAILTNLPTGVKTFLLSIGGFCLGIVWICSNAYWQLERQIPEPLNNQAHIIDAEVIELPAIYPEYCQFEAHIKQAEHDSLLGKMIRLKFYQSECPFRLGQVWQMQVKLKPIHGPVNMAGFDLERFYFENGLDGRGYIRTESLELKSETLNPIHQFRQNSLDHLSELDNAGIFQALLIGEKSSIGSEQRELLQKLGLSHLIAISGLHISIIAGVSYWLINFLWGRVAGLAIGRKWSPLQVGLIGSCLVAFLYSAMADFSIPTIRALIMWCAVASAFLLQRRAAIYDGLMISLLLVLLIFPLSVLSASFWMTFIAVLIISLILMGRTQQKTGWKQKLKLLIKLQLGITLTLAIPSLLYFQQASFLGMFVNIIVIPVFSLIILPAIFLSFLLSLFGVAWPLSQIDALVSDFFQYAEQLIHSKALESLSVLFIDAQIPIFLGILIFLVLLLCCLPLSKIRMPLISFAALMVSLMLIGTKLDRELSDNKWSIEIFDVGHGLSVLLHNNNHTILYDTGYASPGSSAVSSYIIPSLRTLGISHIDTLILSHQDNDHAGGVYELLQNFKVDQIIADSWFDKSSEPCEVGQVIELEGAKLEFFYGEQNAVSDKPNNQSCVVKITINDFSILIPGDIEKDAEYLLASSEGFGKLKSDILIAPHHGSKTSSTYPFIKRVDPGIVIYTSELHSRYPIPHPSVYKRYQEFNIKGQHSGCAGQITINPYDRTLKRWREEQKVWRKEPCEV
ncbi:DNA internalization-related competence protein ComEC/Rec2 [Kangiella koreensis]|uniref:DNA internalization-related competence protein ComEC/Rec2 n=1 Tax=Kangiella koreensis (strain DSM 16069 / JCM 12317 / KCTC 12182 / SW-125) TaxID=523791 RepID=C7RC02_KANKD|nr:DNA internalization-related competence protein ComEC/Rec2 [Kangiella koreensis]ACV26794.1 DNA internalization-related competence protein ComEC/Rec2 [Kangiella koreensis DSM 16069]